jgi:hypothetical protein
VQSYEAVMIENHALRQSLTTLSQSVGRSVLIVDGSLAMSRADLEEHHESAYDADAMLQAFHTLSKQSRELAKRRRAA